MDQVISFFTQAGMTAIAFVVGVVVGTCLGFTIGATPPNPNKHPHK